ncbi:golgi uridine diphosphate-N- acetylglucosamine transporter [Saxophila tyrrhenica]|uniref:Golgi uridine diphosphate-N- acetylglucosamine transporter n=1 Tax=Saxophila tyrrhenica TaxID=1690608 RepID=A0AAV9PL54_9PEZI|nr:golgi uridine diphosphate-N- acetylglucosamine transporter [Saxophila tyrrhenica]
MIPALGPLSIVALIFGGCCSNVFALEAILQSEASSGLLITFAHFICTTLAAYPTQFSSTGPYMLRKPLVPVRKWAVIAAMHFGINILNNWAFSYNISVPVHIILRSFGSVSTMIAGTLRGKRYSRLQVCSVFVLTVGVLVSAWADSESKGKTSSKQSQNSSDFSTGLAVLLVAQCLAAWMGAYVEDVFAEYGASWTENLFYGHLLSLPLFFPISTTLRNQYGRLAATPPLSVDRLIKEDNFMFGLGNPRLLRFVQPVIERLPQGLLFLSINTLTQLACISGVNLLSSKSSAVTVTIVLNIRKLVSFIFSTILFGHDLSNKMIFGSTLVFGSGALYGWETSWRIPQEKKKKEQANGSVEKKDR